MQTGSLYENTSYKEKGRHTRYQSFLLYFSGHGYSPWPNWNALLQDLGFTHKSSPNYPNDHCEDETHMGYIYPYQTTMHEGSGILVEGSSIDQNYHRKISKDPNIPRRMVYPSRSISIHRKIIFRGHRRIQSILRWHPSKHTSFTH